MSEQIIAILKEALNGLPASGGMDAETRRNALKEELQFFVLNFIYHHPAYSEWIMYGGSTLRIIHGLNRMSVDLDFETSRLVTEDFLEELKREIENHFTSTYAAGTDFLSIKITAGRGLILKFSVGDELSAGYPSKQVYVKIDLNHFVANGTVTERQPINHGQLSFVIVTYNMASLMASKLAAIFLRGTRGVGQTFYEEKGRDIYDLLWYMDKKVMPDFDYLVAKGIDVKDPRALFDKLTLQMNKVSDENLKQDLSPLFVSQNAIADWLTHWRESYFRLLEDYEIHTVTGLASIIVHQDFHSDNFSFAYWYETEDGTSIEIIYTISDYWMRYGEGELSIRTDKTLESKMTFEGNGSGDHSVLREKLKQYAALFYQKTEAYFKKVNMVMLGDSISTKTIRMTADNFNQKEQIVLNKFALVSCELDDLLK